MALDNSAAQNAQSLLNGIDYDALIGGPLQAAVRAQAMAAKSTWEFIQQVGLQKDPDGHVSAVNVTFLYQKDGEMVKLIVPILTIVPIPLILIDEVSVQFKANINASASSTTEQSESSALAGELEAQGSIGWGPFSLSARMKASYSSKKDSKATQDSRYSVEYTQDVSVHASQAGVPAGLATVLNILSNAATGASKNGDLQVSPPILIFNGATMTLPQAVQVRLTTSTGLNVKGGDVVLQIPKTNGVDNWKAFSVGLAPVGKVIPWQPDGTIKLKTGDDGSVGLLLSVVDAKSLPTDGIVEMTLSATVDKSAKQFTLPMKVTGLLTSGPTLTPDNPTPSIPKGTSASDKLTARKADGSLAGVVPVKVTYGTGVTVKSGGNTIPSGNSVNTAVGVLALDLDVASGASGTITVDFTATIDGTDVPSKITITVT